MKSILDPAICKEEGKALRAIYEAKKKKLNLTQERIAREGLGEASQSAVSHYMRGSRALTIPTARTFAKFLEVEISTFSPRLDAIIKDKPWSAREKPPSISVESSTIKPEGMHAQSEADLRQNLGFYPIRGKASQIEAVTDSITTFYEQAPSASPEAECGAFWVEVDSAACIDKREMIGVPRGALVLITPYREPLIRGRLYLVQCPAVAEIGSVCLLRRIVMEEGRYVLHALNPEYPDVSMTDKHVIIGLAIDYRAKLGVFF